MSAVISVAYSYCGTQSRALHILIALNFAQSFSKNLRNLRPTFFNSDELHFPEMAGEVEVEDRADWFPGKPVGVRAMSGAFVEVCPPDRAG